MPDSHGDLVRGQVRQHRESVSAAKSLSESMSALARCDGCRGAMAVPGPGSVHGRDLQAGTLAEGAISLRALVLSDPVIPLLGIDPKEVIKDSPRMAIVVSTREESPYRDGAQPQPGGLYCRILCSCANSGVGRTG